MEKGERTQAIGRSRGGRTTKIHALTDRACRPLAILITGGQVPDCVAAHDLLERLPRARIVHGDKGYDSNAIRRRIEADGMMPNIPPKANRRWKSCFSPVLYRQRNAIERMFCRLKDFRRIATRYDRLAVNYLAAVCIAAVVSYSMYRTQLFGIALAVFSATGAGPVLAQVSPEMGFFLTSKGLANGANLGGLAGADQHCQSLAQAAGAGSRTWRAYLSTRVSGNTAAVNARDRIGAGPGATPRACRSPQVSKISIVRTTRSVRKPLSTKMANWSRVEATPQTCTIS